MFNSYICQPLIIQEQTPTKPTRGCRLWTFEHEFAGSWWCICLWWQWWQYFFFASGWIGPPSLKENDLAALKTFSDVYRVLANRPSEVSPLEDLKRHVKICPTIPINNFGHQLAHPFLDPWLFEDFHTVRLMHVNPFKIMGSGIVQLELEEDVTLGFTWQMAKDVRCWFPESTVWWCNVAMENGHGNNIYIYTHVHTTIWYYMKVLSL